MVRRMPGALVVILILTLSGCDDFSLPGQFTLLSLTLEKSVVRPGETCNLTAREGTPPYSASASAGNLYNDGINAADPGSVKDMVYKAGQSIGTVKILLSDSAGHRTEAMITVLPWEPHDFMADGIYGGPKEVKLTWKNTTPGFISGFKLLRSTDVDPFTPVTDAVIDNGGESYSCIDTKAVQPMNYYRLYAVAGDYESSYVEASAKGNP